MSYKDAVSILGELYLKRGPHIYNGAADIEYFNMLATGLKSMDFKSINSLRTCSFFLQLYV